ncbi:MAG TPA: FCD domain-containing protein [Ilumatobacter sp.]|nr:FCD domain-containing protein [Ilumatobacter sp.]
MYCSHWRVTHDANIHIDAQVLQINGDHASGAARSVFRVAEQRPWRPIGAPAVGSTHVRQRTVNGSGETISRGKVTDPLPTITMLEGAAIARGAAALTAAQLEAAHATNDLVRQHLDEPFLPAAVALARSFHQQLVGACPNQHMVALLAAQVAGLGPVSPPVVSRALLERAADEHSELLDLVRSGAPLSSIERFARHHANGAHACCG